MAVPDASTKTFLLYGTDAYVEVNNTDLGATLGDIVINMETELYYPDLAQVRGRLAGTGQVIGGEMSVTVTLAEWSWAVLSTLYHCGSATDADSEDIGSGTLGTITELTDVKVLGCDRNDGKDFIATMPKALVTSPIAVTLAENNESGLEVTFEALYISGAPKRFPGWIQFEA